MDKKEKSEFTDTLNELEKEVGILKSKKQFQHQRMRKIEKMNEEKEKFKREQFQKEEVYARKENQKTAIFAWTSIAVVIMVWAYPYCKSNPVNFWFGVIAVFCSAGKVFEKMSQNKKK